MPDYIQMPTGAPVETQTALEYYETDFNVVLKTTLSILGGQRELLFTPTDRWFETLSQAVKHSFPPTVSHDLLDAAKWDVIGEFVPSDVKDSKEERMKATVNAISSFVDAFAAAHHDATPSTYTDENGNATLDNWAQ